MPEFNGFIESYQGEKDSYQELNKCINNYEMTMKYLNKKL